MKIFKRIAGMFMFLALGLASCSEDVEIKNSLSVSPDKALEFNAKENADVTLTVTTDADKWTYSAPEWIIAKQEGNTLKVNVEDNAADARSGSITFSAGTADQVKINVMQHEAEEGEGGGDVEGEKIAGNIKDASGETNVNVTFDKVTNKASVTLKLTFAEALKSAADVMVYIDKEYLDEYNALNGANTVILKDEALTAQEWPVNIASGQTETELVIEVDGAQLNYSSKYLLPLKVKAVSDNVSFAVKESRVNYVFTKVNPKEVKQMCIMEFNDANPLNVLEYKLADGTYFFDALVLFSGNMGWDAGTNSVRFNARTNEPVINYNTDALIKEYETYIKPIHDAGIKVYMGIMPHHTRAGIKTLSYNGCKWFAEEMAQIIKDCHMDGVFLDEEYVGSDGGQMTAEWSTPANGTGEYFAYQMKKQMKAVVPWDTEVAVYTYSLGWGWSGVTDKDDNTKHTVASYADIMVADYGMAASPKGDQTKKNCTGASLELNRWSGGAMDVERAQNIKKNGYGWVMYFAFNPDPNHSNYTEQATGYFKAAAKGFYDQELQEPTHYYKKLGQGKYDPKRYPLN